MVHNPSEASMHQVDCEDPILPERKKYFDDKDFQVGGKNDAAMIYAQDVK